MTSNDRFFASNIDRDSSPLSYDSETTFAIHLTEISEMRRTDERIFCPYAR